MRRLGAGGGGGGGLGPACVARVEKWGAGGGGGRGALIAKNSRTPQPARDLSFVSSIFVGTESNRIESNRCDRNDDEKPQKGKTKGNNGINSSRSTSMRPHLDLRSSYRHLENLTGEKRSAMSLSNNKRTTIVICVMPVPDGLAQYGSLPPVLKAGEIANSRQGYEVLWTCSDCMKEIISRNFPQNEVFAYPDPTLYAMPKIFLKPFVWMLSQDLPQWMMPSFKKETSEWIFDSYLTIGLGSQKYFDDAVLAVLKVLVTRKVDKVFCFADPVGIIAAQIAGCPVMNFLNMMPVKEAGGRGSTRFNATISGTIRKYSPADIHDDVVKPFSTIYTDKGKFQMVCSLEKAGTDLGSRSRVFVTGFEPKEVSIPKNAQPLDEQALANQRVAFAYFGSASISFKLAKKVLAEAFEIINKEEKNKGNGNNNKPWHCYVGSQFVKTAHSIGNVHYAPYYDARVLLKYADLTFAHGGLMTLFNSLGHGVPMILSSGVTVRETFQLSGGCCYR